MSSTGDRAIAMLSGFGLSRPRRRLRRFAARLVLGAVLSVAQGAAIAQIHATGLTPSDPALLDKLPTARLKRGYVALDRVDLSPSLPPPGDQRKDGTCAAWAAVYGAGSYYARLQLHAPNMTLSPSYVFNQVEHDRKQCAGSKLAEVLLFLMRRGSATLEDYPPSLFCGGRGQGRARRDAGVSNPPTRRSSQTPPDDDAGDKIVKRAFDVDIVRQKLAEGHPVIVGMRTTDAILDNLPAGRYSEHAAGDPAREHGRHALVLVGYDNEKQAFRLMNSWGPDWSDHGYGWISYPSARSEIEEAFSIVSDRPPPTPVPAPAHKPDGPDVGVLACSDLSVVRSPAGYRLQGFVENEADRANVLAVLSANSATLRVSGRPVRAGQIDVRPWPQCEALLALAAPLAAADRPVLRTLDGRTALAIGDRFGFELQAPTTRLSSI